MPSLCSFTVKAAAGSQQAATPLLTAGCRHPLIGQRLTLLSANPTNDDLVLTVEEGATGGGLVGAASLELTQLLSQEGRALTHQSLSLRTNKTSSSSLANADETPRIQFRHDRDII